LIDRRLFKFSYVSAELSLGHRQGWLRIALIRGAVGTRHLGNIMAPQQSASPLGHNAIILNKASMCRLAIAEVEEERPVGARYQSPPLQETIDELDPALHANWRNTVRICHKSIKDGTRFYHSQRVSEAVVGCGCAESGRFDFVIVACLQFLDHQRMICDGIMAAVHDVLEPAS
jgi:hypothetical protein